MLALVAPLLGFMPTIQPFSRAARCRPTTMIVTPLDAVSSPLRKFEVASTAAAAGSPLDDLPFEVIALFATIVLVGILGLVKTGGGLPDTAPTVGLGETREDLAPAAAEAEASSQAEKEKKYFSILADEVKGKRGGSPKNRKKPKKK